MVCKQKSASSARLPLLMHIFFGGLLFLRPADNSFPSLHQSLLNDITRLLFLRNVFTPGHHSRPQCKHQCSVKDIHWRDRPKAVVRWSQSHSNLNRTATRSGSIRLVENSPLGYPILAQRLHRDIDTALQAMLPHSATIHRDLDVNRIVQRRVD